MIQVALVLVAKRFSVAYEKLKVACVRLIDMRIINLIDDAMTEREPQTATGMIGCTNPFFRARSPAQINFPGAPNATEFSDGFKFTLLVELLFVSVFRHLRLRRRARNVADR